MFSSTLSPSGLTSNYFLYFQAVASTDAWWSRRLRTDLRDVGRKVVSRTKGVVKSEAKNFFKQQGKKLIKKGKKKAKKVVKKTVKKLKKVSL